MSKINKVKCQMSKINKVNFDGAYLRSSSGHFWYCAADGQFWDTMSGSPFTTTTSPPFC